MASPVVGPLPSPAFVPKVALVQLEPAANDALTKAFTQCRVQAIPIADDFQQRLTREQFQGCVVRLDDQAPAVLDAVRSSRSNRRAILYGIVPPDGDMRRFFKYGINAVLDSPTDRSATLKVARSTCALLLNELRLYVRIPIVVEVTVETADGKVTGSSREISGGGMSVALTQQLRVEGGNLRVSFTLPQERRVSIAAGISWQNDSLSGFKFKDSDPGRQVVKDWINSFLGLD